MTNYAHTKEGTDPDEWQTLDDHLQGVAAKASIFGGAFGASEWGRVLGQLHDVGKCNPKFQQRLTGEYAGHADHKGTGVKLLQDLQTGFGRIAAYCIAGHHGGLPDYHGRENGSSLERIAERAFVLPEEAHNPLAGFREPEWPFCPQSAFQCSFMTRMLFSALVDADFLDTEAFMDADKHSHRMPGPSLDDLSAALERKLSTFTMSGRINELRAEILAHCREKASLDPGLFTLTVPTGGGKTLTSKAFALDHARLHGKRRIVYVIPYTSIIEQNAEVFRDVFPSGSVIEHHSSFDARTAFSGEDFARESLAEQRHRLACENWDASVVVTTNVQFFESLFASKPSRCRKLHNLADSVIVLDEAQMLPVEYMNPCLRALEELAHNYGTSVVLCTATQPAVRKEDFAGGLTGLGDERELAPDPVRMHEAFRRTELHDRGEMTLPEVADMVRTREQVLCIVNTRARAAELFAQVRDEPGARHLSALMCPAHRSERLEDIRGLLADGLPCRVVSTQLVEAGVDVSFPEVVREMAGLDSITQAAGRCNREGESDELAPVSVFTPAEGLPRSFGAQAGHTGGVLRDPSHRGDPFSPDAIRHYFTLHYWLEGDRLDKYGVMDELSNDDGEWYFRKAEKKFRLIRNTMAPVIIPRGEEAEELARSLHFAEHHGGILRRLQQFTVQVYENQLAALDEAGAVEWIADAYAVLCRMEFYDEETGLTFPGEWEPEDYFA